MGTLACSESTVVTIVPVSAPAAIPFDSLVTPPWTPSFKYDGGKVVSVNDRVLSGRIAFAVSKAITLPQDMVKHKEMTNSRLAVTGLQSTLSVSNRTRSLVNFWFLVQTLNCFALFDRPSKRLW